MKFNTEVGSGDGGDYVKLKAGGSVTGVLRGELHEYEVVWVGGKSVLCTTPGAGKFRFKVNLVVTENGAYVSKILEQGAQVYTQLKALQEAGWDIEETLIKISRVGSTQQDTKYTVVALPQKLNAASLQTIGAVELQELGEKASEPAPGGDYATDANFTTDDIPF